MALNKDNLKAEIKELLTDMRTRDEVSDDEYANRLATAIDNYIRQAEIIYIAGLAAPNGPVTGTFNGNLN